MLRHAVSNKRRTTYVFLTGKVNGVQSGLVTLPAKNTNKRKVRFMTEWMPKSPDAAPMDIGI